MKTCVSSSVLGVPSAPLLVCAGPFWHCPGATPGTASPILTGAALGDPPGARPGAAGSTALLCGLLFVAVPGCCWQGHRLPFSAYNSISCLQPVVYKYLLARAFKGHR